MVVSFSDIKVELLRSLIPLICSVNRKLPPAASWQKTGWYGGSIKHLQRLLTSMSYLIDSSEHRSRLAKSCFFICWKAKQSSAWFTGRNNSILCSLVTMEAKKMAEMIVVDKRSLDVNWALKMTSGRNVLSTIFITTFITDNVHPFIHVINSPLLCTAVRRRGGVEITSTHKCVIYCYFWQAICPLTLILFWYSCVMSCLSMWKLQLLLSL